MRSTPFTILDTEGRIVGVLAGHPGDEGWDQVAADANQAMTDAAKACVFDKDQRDHRRGHFATLARGVSFGGGQLAPGNLINEPGNEQALEALCQHPAMVRIAGFGDSLLATYAPRVFKNMQSKLKRLFEHHPSLSSNFHNSVYPAASFNFGPATVCLPHKDFANDACNFCHITALGRYNPKTSGQIVLVQYKMIIEFPPGSSILIPSAIVTHANLPIQPGEDRQSFTQYCAGGLIRWVDAGFCTLRALSRDDPVGKAAFDRYAEGRLEECLELFSLYDDLTS
ncbi:hypothetical protein GY45DRAFT_1262521 [Cubamyces sp. BRFM 1775]|nr:hypothetical protein GY45DRAFT_1262521 [Cubamyces sp. BRFM 1775]